MNKLKNIINLSKIFIIQNNNFNLINKEKNKINIRSPLLWAIIILFIGLSYISYEVINYLIKIGKPEIFLNGYFLFNAILIIMQTIILATNIFYYSKNMENILYMPFKPREILLAKFNTLVSIIYGTELIFALLPFIIYGIYTNMGILYFINLIISLIIFPIFILLIISSFMMILMKIIKLFKNKDLMQLIISFIAILILFIFINFGIKYIRNDIGNTDTIEQTRNMLNLINEKIININNYFIVINPITNLLIEKNIFKIIFYLIKLILINLIGLIIFIFFGNKIYLKQLLKNNYYEKNNKNKKINLKNKLKKNNKNIAYIKKEIKNIFKNPAFFLQQIYPVILTTILSCILIIIITPKFIQFLNIEENKNLLENLSLDIEAICLILGLTQFVGLFNYSSITAFSREGSDAYIIKLLPISLYKQFIYKNIPQILINTISTILILGTLYFNISGLQNNYIFIIFILAFLLNIINSFILTFIDLINPKINWKYEYEILQNNKNKLFQYSLIILNILFLIYIKNIFNNFNLNKSLIIFAILLIFILLIINLIINKNNKKLFKKIK